jgi:hypothetical protein
LGKNAGQGLAENGECGQEKEKGVECFHDVVIRICRFATICYFCVEKAFPHGQKRHLSRTRSKSP